MEDSTVEARRIIDALERHCLRFIIRAREKKVEMCGIGRTVEFRAVEQVVFQGHDIFRSDTHATAFRAPQLNWNRYILQTGHIREEADRISDYKGLDARVKCGIVLCGPPGSEGITSSRTPAARVEIAQNPKQNNAKISR